MSSSVRIDASLVAWSMGKAAQSRWHQMRHGSAHADLGVLSIAVESQSEGIMECL